ncbi:MAG: hypothetical protein OEZ22_13475 [Spirochaetia bacterium]|nr:hypothetical protein [Spirochaetia bacterium]
MKKNILIITILMTAISFQTAAAGLKTKSPEKFNKGDFFIGANAGLGFGAVFTGNAEYAVHENIGIGGIFGYSSFDLLWDKYKLMLVGVTGEYHIGIDNKDVDLSLGIMVGYFKFIEPKILGANSISTFARGVYVSGRYYIADNVALKGKLGYSLSFIEVGIDFRL